MPLTIILDTIEGSDLNQSAQLGQGSKTRGGWAQGIDGDPATALDQILRAPGMPPLGQTVSVNGRTMVFQNLVVKPTSGDQARLQLVFEAIVFGTATAYIITTRSYEGSVTRSTLPGTRIPLRVPEWVDTTAPQKTVATSTGDKVVSPPKIPSDLAHMTFPRTMREVSVSGVKYGIPKDYAYEQWANYVNDDTWRGLPVGYWRITGGGTNLSRYVGYYSFDIHATTQNDEDWSQLEILRNTTSGRYIEGIQKDYDAILKPDYSYGIIATKPGLLRVGAFRTTNFQSIFGFGGGKISIIPQQ